MRGPEEEQRSFFESFEKKKGEKESFGFERRDSYSRGVGEGGGAVGGDSREGECDILRERVRDSVERGDIGEAVERVRGVSMIV